MISGISGFVEYTNTLIDRETKMMDQVNVKLTECLSSTEREKLDKVFVLFYNENIKNKLFSFDETDLERETWEKDSDKLLG